MAAANVLEIVGVELGKKKAETRRMSKCLRAKKLAVKLKQKELRRIMRVNQLTIALNCRMQKFVDDFLVAAEAENNDPETAKIWTEKAMREVIEGMNDLNLDENNVFTVNQGSGSAADGDNK